jgi:hypothetical protein
MNAGHIALIYKKRWQIELLFKQLKQNFTFEISSHAYFAEKFIKRMKSKVFIQKIIKQPELFTEIIRNAVRAQPRDFGAASSTKPL